MNTQMFLSNSSAARKIFWPSRSLLQAGCFAALISLALPKASSAGSTSPPEAPAKIQTEVVSAGVAVAPANPKMSEPPSQGKSQTEPWKGEVTASSWSAGVLLGLGVVHSLPGFVLAGNVGYRIMPKGFVPDINNSVFLELQVGPVFVSSTIALIYSAHLRWDFTRDEQWKFYALGGLSGFGTPVSMGSVSALYPRFGIGAIWTLHPNFGLRAEVSHEMSVVGAAFCF